jgi:DNA polymerase III delta prime subunit
MLDVEYLLDPRAAGGWPLVYRYRSGILRASMRRTLGEEAERDGSMVFDCAPVDLPSFCVGGGLFSGVSICDWPTGQQAPSTTETIEALNGLCLAEGQRVVLFVPTGNALLRRPEWPDAERASIVIEEPVVRPDTLHSILKYLVHQSKLVRGDGLLSQIGFRRYFDDVIADQDSMDLPDFSQEFNRAVLLYIDPKTGVFSGERAIGERRANLNRIMRPLRGFVEDREQPQLSDLLRGLAGRFPSGRSGGELADELARHTLTLLASKRPYRSVSRSGFERAPSRRFNGADDRTSVLIWTAVLLAFTPGLFEIGTLKDDPRAGFDPVLVRADQMGREFLRRLSSDEAADPLSGLWTELGQVILRARMEEEPVTAQGKLVRQLACRLEQPVPRESQWVERLRSILAEELSNPAAEQGITTSEASVRHHLLPQPEPRYFADIIGHQVAANALRRRLDEQQHNTPLILCGPEGVGKRTLGRLFAKGLLCEGVPNGIASPCGYCEPCTQFETGSLFDFIEFDAGAPFAADYVQEKLLKNLRYASFSRRRPVMISNPEKAPRVVDMCLKTLEAHSDLNRFIFTVTDLKAMSATGQSRCETYRLAPLADEESRQLGRRFLESSAFPCDDRTLGIIVAEAGGLPQRLLDLCRAITGSRAIKLNEVRLALKLDWAEEAISYWRALLSPNELEQGCFGLPPGWPPREAVRRIRLILEEIYCVYATGEIQQGSLLHVDGDPISELASLLGDRATDKGVSFQDLWITLSEYWLSDDHVGPTGFLKAGLQSWTIIYGDPVISSTLT